MSKLDEVIQRLEDIPYPLEDSAWSTIEDSIGTLTELNKPVQYVVGIRPNGPGKFTYLLLDNGNKVFEGIERLYLASARWIVITEINHARRVAGCPPITIEQITFVEV